MSSRPAILAAVVLAAMLPGAIGVSAKGVTSVADPAKACAALQGMTISAESIALPTSGAVVRTAAIVTPTAPASGKPYCSVDGQILPVDPQALPINFNVALPAQWNGKAMHLMGGGWDGFVVKGGNTMVGSEQGAPPVQRGYAAFGSDSGHAYTTPDWQANTEMFENFAGDQLRKTRDVAVALIERRYGKSPRLTYSSGGSGGGREALYVADRWPHLYDGVIAFYPVWAAVPSFMGWIDNGQALAAPGAWSNEAQQAAISRMVIAQCDKLDGAEDGLISDVAACRIAPESLQCPDAASSSDTCLSASQVAGLVRAYGTARKLPYAMANGVDSFQAYNVLNGGAQPRMGKTQPGGPITPENNFGGPGETAFGAVLSEPFVRLVVMRDPKADLFAFRPDLSAAIKERLLYLSSRMDVDPAMERFIAKGGKVILVHGTADQVNSADWSDEFHRRMTAAYGSDKTGRHLRYYRVPGYGHGIGLRQGAQFDLQADLLTALEQWVEQGIAPTGLVATDANAQRRNRTRPLCDYPAIPKYKGSGDLDLAANFACAPP